jgi:hypothetical protein
VNRQEVDERIAAAKARGPRKVKIPGQFESFEIVVESGTEKVPDTQVASHQRDATVHFDDSPAAQAREREAQRENRGAVGQRIADAHTMSSGVGSEPVTIAGVTLRKSGLVGFEKVFSRDSSDYQLVLENGQVLNSIHEIVKQLHAAMWRVKTSKAVAK